MISFTRRTKVFVSKDPTDMRASYDTLFSKAKGVLNQDPFSGHLFVFINSRRNCIKCLYYDGTGLVLLCLCRYRHKHSRTNPVPSQNKHLIAQSRKSKIYTLKPPIAIQYQLVVVHRKNERLSRNAQAFIDQLKTNL